MITSASQYEYVDLSGLPSGIVQGNIYPVRYLAGGGAKHALKYEDLLFMTEAQIERANWEQRDTSAKISAASTLPFALKNSTTQYRSAISSASGSGVRYYMPLANFWTPRNGFINRDSTIRNIYGDLSDAVVDSSISLESVAFSRSPSSFEYTYLDMTQIENNYKNIRKLTRTAYFPPVSALGTCTIKDEGIYIGQDTQSPNYGQEYHLGPDYEYNQTIGELYSKFNRRSFTCYRWAQNISISSPIASFPYAVSATLLMKYIKAYSAYGSGTTTHTSYVAQYQCTVSNGNIYLSNFNMSNEIQNMCSFLGIDYRSSCDFDYHTDEYQLNLTSCALIIDNEFPAEVNSLNWNPT